MALVLTLKEGEDFYVADRRFEVAEITSRTGFVIRSLSPNTGDEQEEWVITDSRSEEIAPDVFVSAGISHIGNLARASIEAPLAIRIMRGERYREQAHA